MSNREKLKAERRSLIVSAAVECFIKNGIHQTGIREIAIKANVSLGNLYNHFSGKDALIAEIAMQDGAGIEQIAKALDGNENPLDAMQEFVNDYLDYVSKAENAFLTIDIMAESLRNPTVAKQFETTRYRLIEALTSIIKRGISDGNMRDQISIEDTVNLLLDAIEGLGLRSGLAQVKPSKKGRKSLQEVVTRMLSIGSE